MLNGFRLGKVFNIEIYISYSWFFIFGLVAVMLTFSIFPAQFPHHSEAVNIVLGLITAALFFASLLLHELSHSLLANLNGIPIKKITLFIFGGMAQMSAEPTDPVSELKMAAAGPLASILLAGFFYGAFRLLSAASWPSYTFAPFIWLWQINLLLAVFNLAPGFPLDGGRVFRATLWLVMGDMDKATNIAAKTGQGFAFLLMGTGFLFLMTGNLGGVWLILIGWFLYQSAVSSYQQLMVQHNLADLRVSEIMTPGVETVTPDISLAAMVDEKFLKYHFSRLPVVEGDKLLGIVTLHDIKKIPRSKWSATTAGQVVEDLREPMFIAEDEPAVKALYKMARENIGHLLVTNADNKLVGIVTRMDILQLIKVKSELRA